MRDVFYTLLVVWIIWRVLNSIKGYGEKRNENVSDFTQNNKAAQGGTSIKYVPPIKNKMNDDDGEYVDYEEVKN
jgi:hypothetical protein